MTLSPVISFVHQVGDGNDDDDEVAEFEGEGSTTSGPAHLIRLLPRSHECTHDTTLLTKKYLHNFFLQLQTVHSLICSKPLLQCLFLKANPALFAQVSSQSEILPR